MDKAVESHSSSNIPNTRVVFQTQKTSGNLGPWEVTLGISRCTTTIRGDKNRPKSLKTAEVYIAHINYLCIYIYICMCVRVYVCIPCGNLTQLWRSTISNIGTVNHLYMVRFP